MTSTLRTLEELEENSNQNISQIEEVFNIKSIENDISKKNGKNLDPNLILSPRSTYSNSSHVSGNAHHGIHKQKSKLLHHLKHHSKKKSSILEKDRSVSSTSNRSINDDNIYDEINDNQSIISSFQNRSKSKQNNEAEHVDYDKLSPTQCGDLTKITYINNSEKYLITRLYSNVSKLNSILSDLDSIHLKYYLNTPDDNECLPLYYAIKADCITTVKLLIDLGASLEKTTSHGDPAIHLACLLGVSLNLIDFLLSFSNQNYLYNTDQEGWNILHCAANQGHTEIVKYLMEHKHMNPNVKDGKHRHTCLQLAAINNRIEIIEYLLSFSSLGSITNKHEFGIVKDNQILPINNIETNNEKHLDNEIDPNNKNYFVTTAENGKKQSLDSINFQQNIKLDLIEKFVNSNSIGQLERSNSNESNKNLQKKASHSNSIDSDKSKCVQTKNDFYEKLHHSSSMDSNSDKKSTYKLEQLKKTQHSNSIESEKSAYNLSYRSNQSSVINKLNSRKITQSKYGKTNTKKFQSNSISEHSMISTISVLSISENINESGITDLETEIGSVSIKKIDRPKISIESMSVYFSKKKFQIQHATFNNSFFIDVNCTNSNGQTVLHLACLHGKYEVVKLLLKKYGSNEIDINALDYKNKTPMDLAFEWLLNLNNNQNYETKHSIKEASLEHIFKRTTEEEKIKTEKASLFYDKESSIYVQCDLLIENNEIDRQMKLMNILYSYGAKFSSHKTLLYDIEMLNKIQDNVLLASRFHYSENFIFLEDLKLNLTNIVPISVYLHCILTLFKLNLPTMFLSENSVMKLKSRPPTSNILNEKPSIKRAFTSIGSFEDTSKISYKTNRDNFIKQMKLDFAKNFHDLIKFIQKNVIDSFESNLYFENIDLAFELISRF